MVTVSTFGTTENGKHVDLYDLTNANGLSLGILTWGGTCTYLKVPDRDGEFDDILLGHDNLEGYLNTKTNPHFNALIGRHGNRINEGKFELNGVAYELPQNSKGHHLHGGWDGLDRVVWNAKLLQTNEYAGVELNYHSPEGEEGYPGNMDITVTYKLTNDNEMIIEYSATTDAPTLCNLTNHNYYNLTGAQENNFGHVLKINADHITPTDAGLIPTGEFTKVDGTPFDFRTAKPIGQDINADHPQIQLAGGFDHNFVLKEDATNPLTFAAEVYEPKSGRGMAIYTTEPGLQFYSGNFLDGSITGKGGKVYEKNFAFCLETQHFPDSPNKPEWPSTVLVPGEKYNSKTVHRFFTR
jgi:aldose 1-epimerase